MEKDIERYLHDRVKKVGGYCMKMENIPGFNGIPDRLVLLPGGLVAFVEVKRAEGKLSTIQKYRIQKLKAMEINVYVAYSKQDVDNLIKNMNGWGEYDARIPSKS